MSFSVYQGNKGLLKVWQKGVLMEDETIQQAGKVAELPFVFKHVALMPDGHVGKGSTIGSVIATKKAIIPAAVGVDIGCGMLAVPTNLTANDLPEDLKKIRHSIEREIPVGFGEYKDHDHLSKEELGVIFGDHSPSYVLGKYNINHGKDSQATQKYLRQVGTLGGGNHFIELCLDGDNNVWIMLHSGSRGIGNKIGTAFIKKAQDLAEQYFLDLPDKNLAYLPEGTDFFSDYMYLVDWAQQYAALNRKVMLRRIIRTLTHYFPQLVVDLENRLINCHHNYISKEHHYGENVYVTRKGAVRAREGELGIIPGSMGAKSFIVRGKGNPESFCSCSHGAGRSMSRKKAAEKYTAEDLKAATAGVECRTDDGVIDEIPHAYKSIDAVMEAQKDLVEPVHTLRQVLCVKG